VVRIDDLDVVRQINISRSDRTRAVLAQGDKHLVAVVQLEHHTLQVEQ